MTHADLVFAGGPVLLPGGARTDAVAVRGGWIVALGADAARDLRSPRTEVVDLAGGLLIPGFQDAHAHPVWAGLELDLCDLVDDTLPGYLATIDAYARSHPQRPWITGAGWAMAVFPGGLPRREDLDAIVADRPVYLVNRDHHGAWVNSRALELAGIDAATPDPPDGRIERDADGRPTGMLQEGAVSLVAAVVPPPTPAELRAALLRAQRVMHGYGITAWQDAAVGTCLGQPDVYDAYLNAATDGDLTARVRGALWWQRDRGLDQLDELRARRDRATVGTFRASTVKIMLDGVAENRFAALLSPYLDGCGTPACVVGDPAHELDTAGLAFVDPIALCEYVSALDRDGFQVHFHTLGDRAVRDALDALEAARTVNGLSGNRHHLAHLQVMDPADVPRFAELRAAATIQALWAAHESQMDELNIPFLGPDRAGHQYPFGALLRAGATLAAGSDWPVTSADPLTAIHVAVNRQLPDAPDSAVFLREQRLDLLAALTAYTAGSAWVNGLDDTGAIRVGALADLAVLDRDPFAFDPSEIASTRVTATYVGGQRVHPD